MDNQVGPVILILYLFAMCLVGLFMDSSNTGMRDKIYDLECELRNARDEIDRLNEELNSREEMLENLRDALHIREDVNNPNKRRRIDQAV